MILEQLYKTTAELKARYENAPQDSQERKDIRVEYKAHRDHSKTCVLEATGQTGDNAPALRVWVMYEDARDNGNAYLDIWDIVWDKDIPALVDAMRALGVDHFTMSSGWSGAIATAGLFVQNGCALEGMVPVADRSGDTVMGLFFKL